jgi:hypothetical protein
MGIWLKNIGSSTLYSIPIQLIIKIIHSKDTEDSDSYSNVDAVSE